MDGHQRSPIFNTVATFSFLVWLVALSAVFFGAGRVVRAIGIVLMISLAIMVTGPWTLVMVLLWALPAVALTATGRRGSAGVPQAWRWTAGLWGLAALGYLSVRFGSPGTVFWYGPQLVLTFAPVVAALVVGIRTSLRAPAWPTAFAIIGVIPIATYVVSSLRYSIEVFFTGDLFLMAELGAELLTILIAFVAVFRRHSARALPKAAEPVQ